MINIKEISSKIEEILNDSDNPLRIGNQRVLFLVATQGYRIDSIYNRKEGKNVIPVFIALSGGENNPIPTLQQTSKSIQVAIYYPIKYKDLFYDLENYLNSKLVGKMINFGTLSGICLTNMGVAEYGEISQMNLQQFAEWVGNTYEKTFDITSNWFSMSFMLYATSLGSGYLFGNDVKYRLSYGVSDFNISVIKMKVPTVVEGVFVEKIINRYTAGDTVNLYAWKDETLDTFYTKVPTTLLDDKIKYLTGQVVNVYESDGVLLAGTIINVYEQKKIPEVITTYTEELVWSNSGTGVSVSPIAQQLINKDSFAKNVPNITNYNKSLVIYVKPTTAFGQLLLICYNKQRLDLLQNMTLVKEYSNGYKFTYESVVLALNENVELGSPLSFTLTLGDKK